MLRFLAAFAITALSLSASTVPAAEATTGIDPAVQARMFSCDATVVRRTIDDLMTNPRSRDDPRMMFYAALAETERGNLEEAAFWYVAMDLRAQRQLLFEQGERAQALQSLREIAASTLPLMLADVNVARRVATRVEEWDRATPDSFRDRREAKTAAMREKLGRIDASLRALPNSSPKDPKAVAKALDEYAQLASYRRTEFDKRCGPGTLDAADAEAATRRIQREAEKLVMAHPLVLDRAGGSIRRTSAGVYTQGKARLPLRLSIYVTPTTVKPFHAEVDAVTTITADRKVGDIKLTLACVTDIDPGRRDAKWKDVCKDDPNATRPPPGTADLGQYAARAAVMYPEAPKCVMAGPPIPGDALIFAAGEYSGRRLAFQIDQSGHEATHMDVVVNKPGKAVVLMLGAYEPTVWTVKWTPQTRIVAAFVSGYHRQAVAGLAKQVPLLLSTYENKGACGYFYVSRDSMQQLNPTARRLFERPVDMVFPAQDGKVLVGDALPSGAKLVAAEDVAPESFRDTSAPLAGEQGLKDAVSKGLIREATDADRDAWVAAVKRSTPPPDVPPVAGGGKEPARYMFRAYVVLGPFTYPAGLYGAHSSAFFIPKGVPAPKGNPGHSPVFDFNTLPEPKR